MTSVNGGGPLVELEHLKVYFPIKSGLVLDRHIGDIRAVDDVSLAIARGETLGLVGESGCGKSTLGRMLAGILSPTRGAVSLEGSLVMARGRKVTTRIQTVFQDPFASLDPRMLVGKTVAEGPLAHRKVSQA